MGLPSFNTKLLELSLMQSAWASAIDPVLNLPTNKGLILKDVELTTGANIVNHKLGRKLVGWSIIRQRAAGSFYDTQDSNNSPNLTLLLQSTTNVSVDLYVF